MIYEVHERGLVDADTGKTAWYQVHTTSPERAAEAYVEQHAQKACSVAVRDWQSGRTHGWYDVEYPVARCEKADAEPTGSVRLGVRDDVDDRHKEEQERPGWRQEEHGE